MSVFGIFISPTEYKFKELLKNKPEELYYTLKNEITENFALQSTNDNILNKEVTICTDKEKEAMLHLFSPFFLFKFNKDEYWIIILGENHNLLKLEKEIAFIYKINSDIFLPIVDEDGNYDNKWYCEDVVIIDSSTPHYKIKMNDVLKAGIQVFWIDTMETLKKIDEEMNNLNVKDGDAKLDYLINQTNWKSDKVIYMNKYKNICPAKQTDDGYIIDYGKQKKRKEAN